MSHTRIWISGGAFALVVAAVFAAEPVSQTGDAAAQSEAAKKTANNAPPADEDITNLVREHNSDKFQAPPTEFRAGHVTPRKLPAEAITATKTGFSIQLPSQAPVPTPTVYDGRLYVSGGFHSKEYYCFHAETGQLVWGVNLDDDGPTAAAASDGVIVFNTESCTVFALDAKTGKLLWSHWLGDPLTSTPTIADGRVFTSYPVTDGGHGNLQINANVANPVQNAPNLAPQQVEQAPAPPAPPQEGAKPDLPRPPATHALACLDLKTGKIIWQRWLDSDVMSAPVAVDGELYVTSFGGTVYRFKQVDGTIVSAHRNRATSAPVVVGKDVFLTQRADDGGKAAAEEQVASVDRDSAERKFSSQRKGAKYLEGQVQARSALKGEAMKLDAGNGFAGGAPAAANPQAAFGNVGQDNVSSMQAFQGSRLLHHGGYNFNCMGDELVCTSPTTGKAEWKVKLSGDLEKEGGFLGSPPAAAGGSIFIATLKGEVLQCDPKSGAVSKRFPMGSPVRFQPAVEKGRIYVGTQDGKVVCIATGDPKHTGWPTWGGNAAHTNVSIAAKQ